MSEGGRGARYSTVVALLNGDYHAADKPSYASMKSVSSKLSGQTVYGVKVEGVPRSTANDVLRGRHEKRLRWELVASLWAVIHYIAAQRGIDTATMTSLEDLRAAFHQPCGTETAGRVPAAPPARPEPAGPQQAQLRETQPRETQSERPWPQSRLRPARPEPAAPCRHRPVAAGRGEPEPLPPGLGAGRLDDGSAPGTGLLVPDPLVTETGARLRPLAVPGPGAGDDLREAARLLLDRVRRDDAGVWWREYRQVVPSWFGPYLTLEPEMSLIRVYAPRRVPGLLQTPGYAGHMIAEDLPGTPAAELRQRVELRQVRQQILHRPDAPNYWAIIDQRALAHHAAPPAVLREQLAHLISMAAYQHITLQLVSSADADHGVPDGPITLMRFPEPALGDIVYLEHHDYGHYVHDAETIEELSLRYARLACKALQPHESVSLLLRMLDRLQP